MNNGTSRSSSEEYEDEDIQPQRQTLKSKFMNAFSSIKEKTIMKLRRKQELEQEDQDEEEKVEEEYVDLNQNSSPKKRKRIRQKKKPKKSKVEEKKKEEPEEEEEEKNEVSDTSSDLSFEDEETSAHMFEDIRKQSQPFWYSKLISRRYFIVIAVSLATYVYCLMLCFNNGLLKFNSPAYRDYFPYTHPATKQGDVMNKANDAMANAIRKYIDDFSKRFSILYQETPILTAIQERIIPVQGDSIGIAYKCKGDCDTIFTIEKQKQIIAFEESVYRLSQWWELCYKGSNGDCPSDSYQNITRNFIGLRDNNITQEKIDQKMKELASDRGWFKDHRSLLGNGFSADNPKSNIQVNLMIFGSPLIKTLDDGQVVNLTDSQAKEVYKSLVMKVYDMQYDFDSDDLEVCIFTYNLAFQMILDYTYEDLVICLMCGIFIWMYLIFHIRSFFIASFAMINIFMSIPVTVVVYHYIFGIKYFALLHNLVIIIELGIGADDVFVFNDAWNQAKHISILRKNRDKRMAYTFRKAAKGMFVTSLTTMVSFLATSISSIVPIMTFGMFAAIIIPINYFLVVSITPCYYIIFDIYLRKRCRWCRYRFRSKKKPIFNQIILPSPSRLREERSGNSEILEQLNATAADYDESENPYLEFDRKEREKYQDIILREKVGKVEIFFSKLSQYVFKLRYIIVTLTLIWLGISLFLSTKIKPLSDNDKFLHPNNPIQKAIDWSTYELYSFPYLQIEILFGVQKELDKTGVDFYDFEQGKLTYDPNFNFAREDNQQFMLDFCDKLQEYEYVYSSAEQTKKSQLRCWIYAFKQWVVSNGMKFPVMEKEFESILLEWILKGGGQGFLFDETIGVIDYKLKIIKSGFVSNILNRQSYDKKLEYFQKLEQYVGEISEKAPTGMKYVFQVATGDAWGLMALQQSLYSNAMQGFYFSLLFTFVVMFFMTLNIIITIYCVLAIAGILGSILAIIQFIGWELGVSESLAMIVFVGLSVDYVVHIAHHYCESVHPGRKARQEDSYKAIGLSIFSSAITTFSAGIFLFFTHLYILYKFGILIMYTMVLAVYYAMIFLPALNFILGPERKQGDFHHYCWKPFMRKVFKVKYEEDKTEEEKEAEGAVELDKSSSDSSDSSDSDDEDLQSGKQVKEKRRNKNNYGIQ